MARGYRARVYGPSRGRHWRKYPGYDQDTVKIVIVIFWFVSLLPMILMGPWGFALYFVFTVWMFREMARGG